MITFNNKSIHYEFSRQGEVFRIDGLIIITGNNTISDLNSSIYTLDDQFVGNLYYTETPEGRCSESISDYYIDRRQEILEFLNETVNELKTFLLSGQI